MKESAELLAVFGQAFAIIAACLAIISGIDAWRREFIGKRRIELAEEVLAAFFEIKDAIAFIRGPFGNSDEGKSRKRGNNETAEETQMLDRGYVVYERYEQRTDIFNKFNILKYKFMAAFGPETETIFVECNKTLSSIFVSARLLAKIYWKRQGRIPMNEEQTNEHFEKMERHEGIVWDMLNENDEIRKNLQIIQEKLDEVTRPCFEESAKMYTSLTKKWFSKR